MFCPQCSEKLERGLYTDLDVKVMKLLLELEKKFIKLQKTGYVKSVNGGDTIFIILRSGDLGRFEVREVAQLRKVLSDELGKHVRLIENHPDPLKFLERVAAPARIVAVNKIWLPDGSEETRVIFDHERNLKVGGEALKKVLEEVKGMRLMIDFERRCFWRPQRKERAPRGAAARR
jgi:transcription antitermination factor NusA-like protein